MLGVSLGAIIHILTWSLEASRAEVGSVCFVFVPKGRAITIVSVDAVMDVHGLSL